MNAIVKFIIKKVLFNYKRIIEPKTINNYGVKISDGYHISQNIRNYLYSGAYEREEISILKDMLDSDDKILEIGTGLGFLTIFIAKQIGNSNIVSYEANPNLIKHIDRNFHLNNVKPKLENAILSDKAGECEFHIHEHFWSSSVIERSGSLESVNIRTEDINKVVDDNNVNFLIIDIEGGESDLIYKITFENIRKLLIEIHPHVIGNHVSSKIVSFLIDKGFSINFNYKNGNVFYFER